jgi:hypothetical protein
LPAPDRLSKVVLRNAIGGFQVGDGAVKLGKQFKKSVPPRKLSLEWDYLGTIRRGEHVTVLYRVRSSEKEGEWLGRLVLGYEQGEIRIFSASIF